MMNRWQKGHECQDVDFKSSDGSIEAKLSSGAKIKAAPDRQYLPSEYQEV
jgi:hypothetical protein